MTFLQKEFVGSKENDSSAGIFHVRINNWRERKLIFENGVCALLPLHVCVYGKPLFFRHRLEVYAAYVTVVSFSFLHERSTKRPLRRLNDCVISLRDAQETPRED